MNKHLLVNPPPIMYSGKFPAIQLGVVQAMIFIQGFSTVSLPLIFVVLLKTLRPSHRVTRRSTISLSKGFSRLPSSLDSIVITAAEITIESSELGNLLNPLDREMVDLLVTLWDGRKVFNKTTKMSGSETVENPWINIIACTTPSWIAGNFPEYMIGGGFTSRCLFIYAEVKEKYVAYPALQVPASLGDTQRKLVQDLERISLLSGPFRLLPSAVEWGSTWYKYHYENRPKNLDDDRFGGYIARKQTHLHKLAMVLAASQRDELTLTVEDLQAANVMLTDLELDMPQVFVRIGKSEQAVQAERLIIYVKARGACSYEEVYRFLHSHFPSEKDMEGVVSGAIKAGLLELSQIGEVWVLRAKNLIDPARGSGG